MQFTGKLLLPDEPGPGLRVNLDAAEHHLAVESDDGGLGAWPLEVVDVERLQGDVFALTVAGEPLQFIADDTLGFAYYGVPTIERVSTRRPRTRSALRSMLDWIWNGPEKRAPSVAVEPEPEEPASPHGPDEESPIPAIGANVAPDVVEDSSELVVDADDVVIDTDKVVDTREESVPESMSDRTEPAADEDASQAGGCPAIRSDGRRCESMILTSSGYCYPHDPKRAFEDRYQAAQEARAQLKRNATERLNRVYGRLDKAMRQVERGELDPETAMAMAQLAQTMCAILDMDEPNDGGHS